MMCGASSWIALLVVVGAPLAADADLPALRGLFKDAQDVDDMSARALSGQEKHLEGDECDGKDDGWRCEHGYVLLCKGGTATSFKKCPFFQKCEEGLVNGTITAFCQEDLCDDKEDGFHCKDDQIVECSGGRATSHKTCPFYQECEEGDRVNGTAVAFCQEDVCDDKEDGFHCKDDQVVECSGGRTTSHETCPFYQECEEGDMVNGTARAFCQEDACEDREDGFHCKDDHIVECSGRLTVNTTMCAFYQECKKDDSVHPSIVWCAEDVCDDHDNGLFCEGDRVVQCLDGTTVNVTECGITEECQSHAFGEKRAACQQGNLV